MIARWGRKVAPNAVRTPHCVLEIAQPIPRKDTEFHRFRIFAERGLPLASGPLRMGREHPNFEELALGPRPAHLPSGTVLDRDEPAGNSLTWLKRRPESGASLIPPKPKFRPPVVSTSWPTRFDRPEHSGTWLTQGLAWVGETSSLFWVGCAAAACVVLALFIGAIALRHPNPKPAATVQGPAPVADKVVVPERALPTNTSAMTESSVVTATPAVIERPSAPVSSAVRSPKSARKPLSREWTHRRRHHHSAYSLAKERRRNRTHHGRVESSPA